MGIFDRKPAEEPAEEPKDEGSKLSEDEKKKLEAARLLGFEVPDDAKVGAAGTISFGLGPEGITGGEHLAQLLEVTWLNARSAGAPVDALEHFAGMLLGGFAMALAHACADTEDSDGSSNPAQMLMALMSQTNSERAEKAAELCQLASDNLERFSLVVENDTPEVKRDTPPLVDSDAAAELSKLFEATAEEGKENDNKDT